MDRIAPASSTPTEINHERPSPQTSACWGRLFQILTAPFFCCKKQSRTDGVLHPQHHMHLEEEQTLLGGNRDPESQHTMNGHHADGMRLRRVMPASTSVYTDAQTNYM